MWSAEDSVGQVAAIKILHAKHLNGRAGAGSRKRLSRFVTEIEFLRTCRHPGVLPYLDDYIPQSPGVYDRPWLATRLAQPLLDVLRLQPQQLERLVSIVLSVANTLADLHRDQIFHRDIKPQNILVLEGAPVLSDFGLVDFPGKTPITSSSEVLGARHFIAPEMMENASDLPGGPADVYSLAKTLWVLATGRKYPIPGEQRPFVSDHTITAHRESPCSKYLDTLIDQSTRTRAHERPTMRQFADELRVMVGSGPAGSNESVDLREIGRRINAIEAAANQVAAVREQNSRTFSGLVNRALHGLKDFEKTCVLVSLPPWIARHRTILMRLQRERNRSDPKVISEDGVALVLISRSAKTRMTCGYGFELREDDTVRVLAGIVIHEQLGIGKRDRETWISSDLRTYPVGSASLAATIEEFDSQLHAQFPKAIEYLAKSIGAIPQAAQIST